MPAGKNMLGQSVIRKTLYYWVPFLAYCGLIFYGSSRSYNINSFSIPGTDKLIHFCEYFLLLVFTLRCFCYAGGATVRKHCALFSIIFCLFYAASDELHQLFVPHRDCSLLDFAVDGAGILAAAWLLRKTYAANTGSITGAINDGIV